MAQTLTAIPADQQHFLVGLWSGKNVSRTVVLTLVALVVRGAALGYQDYHVDETFYLMTGDAMRHGAMPYVDIWDRKPLGLFALYALLATISPTVWSYQIAALCFVVGTSLLVTGLARRWSDETGAILAGVFYIAWLQPLLGGGGQAPVFYNLFVVAAVSLLARSALDDRRSVSLQSSLGAALLCGIAVWLKQTAIFEGAFVILGFGWLAWQRMHAKAQAIGLFCAMALLAMLPTASGFAWYAAHGHLTEMWQATVLSNFHKVPALPFVRQHTIRYLILLTLLLWSCAILGLNQARKDNTNVGFRSFVLCWLAAALAGFIAVPNFYSHYALPLVPVFAVASAPFFANRPLGPVMAIFAAIWAMADGQSFALTHTAQANERFARMIAVVRSNMPHNRLFVFNGSPWIYHETGARTLSRFVFPEHLALRTEALAIGADPEAEVQHILSLQPDVIVLEDDIPPDVNLTTLKLVLNSLDRQYHIVCYLPGRRVEQEFHYFIYARTQNPDRSNCLAASAGSLRMPMYRDFEEGRVWIKR